MNANISSVNTESYRKLEEKSNVVRNAPETNLAIYHSNQSVENKQKPDSNSKQLYYTSSSPMKNIHSMVAGKRQTYKLVDSKQMSKPFQQTDKKISLLDTYARIAATKNKRCSKRLLELAMPRRRARNNNQNDSPTSLNLNHWHTIKTYSAKMRRNAENSTAK